MEAKALETNDDDGCRQALGPAPQAIQALVPLGAFLGVLGVYYSLK